MPHPVKYNKDNNVKFALLVKRCSCNVTWRFSSSVILEAHCPYSNYKISKIRFSILNKVFSIMIERLLLVESYQQYVTSEIIS